MFNTDEKSLSDKRVKIGRAVKKPINKNRAVFIIGGIFFPIVSFFVFYVYVNTSSFVLAFQDNRTKEFTFNNFLAVFESLKDTNGTLRIALFNTFKYFAKDIAMMFLNLIFSFFIYKKILGWKFYRIVFYLPAIIPGLCLAACFAEFIKPNGPVGVVMEMIGRPLPVEGLLQNSLTATPILIFFTIWTGFTGMLFYHGALARIPVEVIEAAKLDGCTPFRECFSIILPLIWPTFATLLIISMAGIFGASGPILYFTQGKFETTTLAYWMFTEVYGNGTFGGTGTYGTISAAGMVFTAIGLPIILFTKWLTEKVPVVEY